MSWPPLAKKGPALQRTLQIGGITRLVAEINPESAMLPAMMIPLFIIAVRTVVVAIIVGTRLIVPPVFLIVALLAVVMPVIALLMIAVMAMADIDLYAGFRRS